MDGDRAIDGDRVMSGDRARLYQDLAEVLAEPAGWLIRSGREWPLFAAVVRLSDRSAAALTAARRLAYVPAESLAARRARYRALIYGATQSPIWLYESLHRNGRSPGPVTWELARLYQAAGLAVIGAELPDHAAVELSFLAYLAQRQVDEPADASAWRRLECQFIRQHAGGWLPAVGQALAATGDPVYGPVGELLAGWLAEAARSSRPAPPRERALPALTGPGTCTLCGFCTQVCPTRALAIHETATMTSLQLAPGACISCGQCVRVCGPGVLGMNGRSHPTDQPGTSWPLRQSPRVRCAACDRPTISQAEWDYLAGQLGPTSWLALCLDCRAAGASRRPAVQATIYQEGTR